ncbi:hypothetical protein CDD83_6255 [Cordyceps sp. RAO-2017]|nr:hypothetical protein CDD83_6255 [Cordyceps sp. RAO-2017]
MRHPSLVLALGLAVLGPGSRAAPPDITFLCDEMPDVCTNMCWAAACADPSFGQGLTLDLPVPSEAERRCRLEAAGCGAGRCGNATATTCNAYPFPEARESKGGHVVTRCVPADQQQKQQTDIDLLVERYKARLDPDRRWARVNFGNPGSDGVRFCLGEPCVYDGLQRQAGKRLGGRAVSGAPPVHVYKMQSGMWMSAFHEMEPSGNITRRVGANESPQSDLRTFEEQVNGNKVDMLEDTVAKQVSVEQYRQERDARLRDTV